MVLVFLEHLLRVRLRADAGGVPADQVHVDGDLEADAPHPGRLLRHVLGNWKPGLWSGFWICQLLH